MNIEGAVALVTGANRGLGKVFVVQLLERGANKVYSAARHTAGLEADERVVSVELDITDADDVTAAAALASDVDLLINNAGITCLSSLVSGEESILREEMETNFFGTLAMVRAFAPVLARNGGGAVLNVASIMAWLGAPYSNGYGASKAAVWALTNGLRIELIEQNTQVSSLLMASTDTDMVADFDIPKNDPRDVVTAALDGIESGELEIVADETTRAVKAALSGDPADLYPNAVRHPTTPAARRR